METGIYVDNSSNVGHVATAAEAIDMLLRTAAEVRTPEAVLLKALDVLGGSTERPMVNVSHSSITDESVTRTLR